MNKNNIFNFLKYAIFAGILYFVVKKIPSININEYEILMLIVIIGAGLYSYECLLDGYFNKGDDNLERFTDDYEKLDDSLELDVDIDNKYSSLDRPYVVSNQMMTRAKIAAEKLRKEKEAIKRAEEAKRKAEEDKRKAEQARRLALEKIRKAEEERLKRLEEKRIADEKLKRAEEERILREKERRIAEEERRQAELLEIEARNIAEKERARKMKLEAIEAKKEAERLKLLAIQRKLRAEEEKRVAEEKLKIAEERKRKAEEEKRIAEEQKRLAEEKIRKALEEKRMAELKARDEENKVSLLKSKIDESNLPNFKVSKKEVVPVDEVIPLSEDLDYPELEIEDILKNTPIGQFDNKLAATKVSLEKLRKGVNRGDIPDYNLDEIDSDDERELIASGILNKDVDIKTLIQAKEILDDSKLFTAPRKKSKISKKFNNIEAEELSPVDDDSVFMKPIEEKESKKYISKVDSFKKEIKKVDATIKKAQEEKKFIEEKINIAEEKIQIGENNRILATEEIKMAEALELEAENEEELRSAKKQRLIAIKEKKEAEEIIKKFKTEKKIAVEEKFIVEKEIKVAKVERNKRMISLDAVKSNNFDVAGNDIQQDNYDETETDDYVNQLENKFKKNNVVMDKSSQNYISKKKLVNEKSGRVSTLGMKSNKIDYKIDDEIDLKHRKSSDMPVVQDSDILPEAIDDRMNKKFSGVKNLQSKKSKKLNQLTDMQNNSDSINKMVYRDPNVGVFRDGLDDRVENENKKLYNELIIPNALNPEDLQKYGLNKFDIQDEILKNAGVQDYDQVFQESNYKLLNDLDDKGIVRKKYTEAGPKVLRVSSAFVKGTADSEKILVDPKTGKEVKLSNLEDDYVKIDKESGKKYVFIEKDDSSGEVNKIYIDDNDQPVEVVDDPRKEIKKLKQETKKPKLLTMGDSVGLDDYTERKYFDNEYNNTYRKTEDILDDYRHDYRRKKTVSQPEHRRKYPDPQDITESDFVDYKIKPKSNIVDETYEPSNLELSDTDSTNPEEKSLQKQITKVVLQKNNDGTIVKRRIPVTRIDDESEYIIEDPVDGKITKVVVQRKENGKLVKKSVELPKSKPLPEKIKSKKINVPINVKSKLVKRDPIVEQEDVIPSIVRKAMKKTKELNTKIIPKKKVIKKVFRDLDDIEEEQIAKQSIEYNKKINDVEIESEDEGPSVLEVSFRLENIEYDDLSDSQRSSIVQDVRARYAVELGITRNAVEVEILPGSVIVNVKIKVDEINEDKIDVAKKMVEYKESAIEEIVNTVSNITNTQLVDIDDTFPDMVVKELEIKEDTIESEDIDRPIKKKKVVNELKKQKKSTSKPEVVKSQPKSKVQAKPKAQPQSKVETKTKVQAKSKIQKKSESQPKSMIESRQVIDEDIIENEDDVEEDVIQQVSTVPSDQMPAAVVNTMGDSTPESEIRKLKKKSGPRPVPNLISKKSIAPTPKTKIKSNNQLENEALERNRKEAEEGSFELENGMRRRSQNEVNEVKKQVRKAERQQAVKKIKDSISGKPVFEVKEKPVREKEIKEKVIIRENKYHHHHHHDPIHDELGDNYLYDEIKELKRQLKDSKKKKTGPVDDIEKRNVKILLKELLANKVLSKEEVEEIYSSAKKGDVDLKELILALEKLRDTTSYVKPSKDSSGTPESAAVQTAKSKNIRDSLYGDMKYDELPLDKKIPIGDQLPPDDWDNEYTLLNTDKWTVPQRKPPLCIASNNLDPLPSNEAGYPMLLKEWDNSRVISNNYINRKWAMDQVDSSGF